MRSLQMTSTWVLVLATTLWAEQPAAPAKAPENIGDLSVLILPFTPIGDVPAAWLSDAVQQNILSELSRTTGLMPLTPTTRPTQLLDLKSAKAEADKAGASIVLYGTYQSTDAGIRLNGQLLDARNGRFIGGVKATGTMKEVFALEDAVSNQVKRILTQHRLAQYPPQSVAAAPAPAAQPAPQPAAPPQDVIWPWDRDNWLIDRARERVYSDDYYPSYYNYRYSSGLYGYPFGFYVNYPSWSGFHHHHHGGGYRNYGPTFFPGGVISGRATFFPGGVVRW